MSVCKDLVIPSQSTVSPQFSLLRLETPEVQYSGGQYLNYSLVNRSLLCHKAKSFKS